MDKKIYKVKLEAEIHVEVTTDSEDGAETLAYDAIHIRVLPGYSTKLIDEWATVIDIEEK